MRRTAQQQRLASYSWCGRVELCDVRGVDALPTLGDTQAARGVSNGLSVQVSGFHALLPLASSTPDGGFSQRCRRLRCAIRPRAVSAQILAESSWTLPKTLIGRHSRRELWQQRKILDLSESTNFDCARQLQLAFPELDAGSLPRLLRGVVDRRIRCGSEGVDIAWRFSC